VLNIGDLKNVRLFHLQLGHLRHNHDGEKVSETKSCQLCAEKFGSIRELVTFQNPPFNLVITTAPT